MPGFDGNGTVHDGNGTSMQCADVYQCSYLICEYNFRYVSVSQSCSMSENSLTSRSHSEYFNKILSVYLLLCEWTIPQIMTLILYIAYKKNVSLDTIKTLIILYCTIFVMLGLVTRSVCLSTVVFVRNTYDLNYPDFIMINTYYEFIQICVLILVNELVVCISVIRACVSLMSEISTEVELIDHSDTSRDYRFDLPSD